MDLLGWVTGTQCLLNMTHAFMGLTVKGLNQMSNQAMSTESKSLQQRSRGLPEHLGDGKETGRHE